MFYNRINDIQLSVQENAMSKRSVRLALCITYPWQKLVELSTVYIN
jgi:hypothetical protein